MQVEKMRAFVIKFAFYCIIFALTYAAFRYIIPVLFPFLLGFFFAFVLQGPIDSVCAKHESWRKPIALVTLLLFYTLFICIAIIFGTRIVALGTMLFQQLPVLYTDTILPAISVAQSTINNFIFGINPDLSIFLADWNTSILSSLSSLVGTVSSSALSILGSVASWVPSFFINLIVTIIVSFFCVVDYKSITSFLLRQMPHRWQRLMVNVKHHVVGTSFKFLRAYAILLSLTFVELCIGLSLLQVKNAFLIAFFIAIVDVLPILGCGTILIPWGVIMLLLGRYPMGVALLILYLIITIIRQSLEPRIVGKQIGLHPLLTLACMFLGTSLFGFWGLFGLPLLATILVQLQKSGEYQFFKS